MDTMVIVSALAMLIALYNLYESKQITSQIDDLLAENNKQKAELQQLRTLQFTTVKTVDTVIKTLDERVLDKKSSVINGIKNVFGRK